MDAFYKIEDTKIEDGKVQISVLVNPHHPIYKAHFPGYPITPGAMLVRMAIEVVAGYCGLPNDAHEVKNVKFVHPHIPTEQQRLTYLFNVAQQPVEVVVRQEDITYAKMMLVF